MAQKLFDKASLVMIPSQYKEGKIYNIKPEDQSSSFEFERGSAATRVNSSGLIENSPTNGIELVTNGGFDTDTTGWGLGAEWSYINQTIQYPESSVNSNKTSQTLSTILSSNKTYKFTFDIITEGNAYTLIRFKHEGVSSYDNVTNSYQYLSSGTYTYYVNPSANLESLEIWGHNSSDTFSIDNVSVQEVNTDTPRLDYSGTEPALLLEPQRTNLFEDSQYITGNTQTSTGGLLPERDSSVQTPDGLNNADKMVRAIAETRTYASVHQNVTVSSGQPYSLSCYSWNKQIPSTTVYLI